MKKFVRTRGQGISANKTTVEEPLEREIARMKREKSPIPGGASCVYMPEEDDVNIWCDFNMSILDIARLAKGQKEAAAIAKEKPAGQESLGNESEGTPAEAGE